MEKHGETPRAMRGARGTPARLQSGSPEVDPAEKQGQRSRKSPGGGPVMSPARRCSECGPGRRLADSIALCGPIEQAKRRRHATSKGTAPSVPMFIDFSSALAQRSGRHLESQKGHKRVVTLACKMGKIGRRPAPRVTPMDNSSVSSRRGLRRQVAPPTFHRRPQSSARGRCVGTRRKCILRNGRASPTQAGP